jgi:ubiquinone/menaquinone biosynthesis C-methylase UbiE
MSTPPHNRELASTYFVQDRHNQKELTRLQIQDQMITTSMGGVLSEQVDPTSFGQVLDVGSGTGGWLTEAAKMYPKLYQLVGVDISSTMVTFAQAQAEAQQVDDRVKFYVMDALRQLEFPSSTFGLVNLRFGCSYVRIWEWPNLLVEMLRVCRPGGVVRLTEPTVIQQSSSPALIQLCDMLQHALFLAGYLFEQTSIGITAHLAGMLQQYGAQHVQMKDYALEYRAGTAEGQAFSQDMIYAFQTLRPFIARRGCVPKDYDTIYQQACSEIQQPDFQATWTFRTAWGEAR